MAKTPEQFPDTGKSEEVVSQQQKTEEGKATEIKEKESLSPVFVLYRENDLYQKYVPNVVTKLKAMGRRVEIHAFPGEVNQEEIERWAEEHKEEFKGKELLLDDTSWGQLPDEVKGGEYKKTGLDQLFDKVIIGAIWREILGENPPAKLGGLLKGERLEVLESEEVGEGEIHDIFVSLVKRILEQRENIPERVYIFLGNLLDHEPFYAWKEDTERVAGRTSQQIEVEMEKEVADEIKKWFIEAGIPSQNIQVADIKEVVGDMGTLIGSERQEKIEEAMKELGHTHTWFVSDRHYGRGIFQFTKESPMEQGRVLYLPLSSFYRSAVQAGLLKSSDEALRGEMDRALQEKFGKEPEDK